MTTTVVDTWASDSDGYTHFFCHPPIDGIVVAEVSGLTHEYMGPIDSQGNPSFMKGDPVTEVTVGLQGSRDFEIPGTVEKITFPDGTVWTPKGPST
jgi:hypothetical protein